MLVTRGEAGIIGAMFELKTATDRAWLDVVLADFDSFLLDHAACERKASATGMSFVVRYPDRREILDALIEFAREELDHFHQVYRLCADRGLQLGSDERDPYVSELMRWVRTGRDHRLLDRLLVAGVVEARGCERFQLVSQGVGDPDLQRFYRDITRAEARHHGLFLRLARRCFDDAEITPRLADLLDCEAAIVAALPLRPALH